MAQWINLLWNNNFINPPPLPWLSEISGAIHLALPGLTAGWLAGWQAQFVQLAVDRNIRFFATFNKQTAVPMHLSS